MNLRKAIKTAKELLKETGGIHLVVELGGGGYEAVPAPAYDNRWGIYYVAVPAEWILSISHGNRKTGAIPSISLHPDITCSGKGRPCHTRGLKGVPYREQPPWCYALRNMADFRKTIDAAWKRNCKIWKQSPDLFFWQAEAYLRKHTPSHFRWFVGGGCPDQDFLDRSKVLASRIDLTKFLMFDKGYDIGLDYSGEPSNMAIVLSTWPGMALPGPEYDEFPRAWLNIDWRHPVGGKECSDNCTKCGLCWDLKNNGGHVVMHVH